MRSITMRAGDCFTVGDGTVVQVSRTNGDRVHLNIDTTKKLSLLRAEVFDSSEDSKERLKQMAQEVISEISELDSAQSKELLGTFVSELFLSVAEQERQELRRQKQAEGIAAAKARGVRFGREPKPLPDHFEECYEAIQDGRMTVTEAAQVCGTSRNGIYRALERKRKMTSYAV